MIDLTKGGHFFTCVQPLYVERLRPSTRG